MFEECFGDGPFIFRINDNGTGPQLLSQVCLERGWREYSPEATPTDQWNLWWRTSGFPINHHRNLYAWQYINHIPKGSTICRKDNLVRYLRCMRKVYGSIYDFSPNGFNLPLEYTKLAAECSRTRTESIDDKPIWICKPVAQSQGRGIFLFRKLSELNYDSNTIVQKYIEKPLLIGGYKFDLRLYVCITSYYPITIYMYREGLARFGTDKFSLNDLRNPFRHLTNSSINKLGPGYAELKDRIGSGCKWTLRQLRRYFQQAAINDWLLWQRISSLVILTVLSHVSQIPPTVNCFEFFGFDVLIDESLRPWLLEVNLSPALSNDCDADRLVKKPMLHDLFDLLGLPVYNTGLAVFELWAMDEEKEDVENNAIVVNATNRWRRKQKKMSAKNKSRTSSATTPKIVNLPNLMPKLKPNYEITDKFKITEGETVRKKKWGNGRDWSYASDREGGWIRTWPMLPTAQQLTIKQIVAKIIKYTKTAKELARNHPNASECQLNEFLQNELNIPGEIWMPPI